MQKVIFIHSAAIDDFVATAVLSQMSNIEIQCVLVINADCIAKPAMDVTSRVNQFLGVTAPIGLSTARGFNAFPWGYRSDCIRMGNIDALSNYESKWNVNMPDAETLLLNALTNTTEKVTVLCTGPITTLTSVLEDNPSLIEKVGDVIWMAGAVNVDGNLDGGDPVTTPMKIPTIIANKYAEWNVFFDPFASATLFQMFSNVKLFPLDITDKAKITTDFKARLASQAKTWLNSEFALQAYALVSDEPFYEMWNTCATIWLGQQSGIFDNPQQSQLSVDTWGNDIQGRITSSNNPPNTNEQDVYVNFADINNFYDYVLQLLCSPIIVD